MICYLGKIKDAKKCLELIIYKKGGRDDKKGN